MKDYYQILEVNKSASPETISKVYKFLAKKYHPDANLENPQEAEEKFKEISEAYEILSNEEKRKKYDEELDKFNSHIYIDYSEFESLQNYCINLENELNRIKSNKVTYSTSNYAHNSSNNYNNYSSNCVCSTPIENTNNLRSSYYKNILEYI